MKKAGICGLLLAGCLLAACGQEKGASDWQTVTITPEDISGAQKEMSKEAAGAKAQENPQDSQAAAKQENAQSGQEGAAKQENDQNSQTDTAKQEGTASDSTKASGGLIEEQTFQLNLVPYGEVTFASYAPDTGKDPNGDASFAILKDGQTVYTLPEVYEKNSCPGNAFHGVEAVSFPDINQDGCDDIIIICQYIRGAGPQAGETFSEARIYCGSENGDFTLKREMMEAANSALAEVTVKTVLGFLGVGTKNADSSAEVSGSGAETFLQGWQQAYIEQIQKEQESGGYSGYELIRVDGDEIPELVEIGDCEAAGCRIVSYYDGKVTVTQLNRLYFSYLEGEGLLCNSEGNMDCYYDLVYRLEKGEMTLIAAGYYGAEDNSNVQFDEEGEPIYQYEWEGVKMSREEYGQALMAVYDMSRARDGYAWPPSSAEEIIMRLRAQ